MYVDEEKKAKAEKLYNENIKMATHYANKFSTYIKYGVLDYDDLLQTANLSLWKACLTFDDTKGHKFFTYASRCLLNDLIMFKNKSFKEDREDYISYDSKVQDEQDSTFIDLLLGDVSLEESMASELFINEVVDKIKDYYLFEGKDQYIPIIDNILNHYSVKELIEVFDYERKQIKNCFDVMKYAFSKDSNESDVFEIKVKIYRYYKDYVIKARKVLREYDESKDGSKKQFKYFTNAEVALSKLRDEGYSSLANKLK